MVHTNFNMPNKASIGKRLREQREALGLTQDTLAARLGKSRNTIGAWERGEQYPSAAFMAQAPEWGFDMIYLLTGRRAIEAIRELTADEAALLDTYRGATDDGKALARSVLGMAQKPGAKARG
jgi:transcriptional regulator with XRE-family HTH domain